MTAARHLRRIRICIAIVFAGLFLSGVTAFPLVAETGWLFRLVSHTGITPLVDWVRNVHQALVVTGAYFPFLSYGTDWLAFAHIVLAVLFIGPWRDPVRNKWVLQFGIIACVGVFPLALIAGPIRGIPLFWRLGDCCFGLFGAIPLVIALHDTNQLEATFGPMRQRPGQT